MKIENENSFREAINKGINIFTGAGFSTMAYDTKGVKLPTGAELLKELIDKFEMEASNLSQLSTILRATRNSDFQTFLTKRFTVESFSGLYKHLNKVAVKYYFTTNIDNLIPQIIGSNSFKYLCDIRDNGEDEDNNSICYLPLHGNVDRPEKGYVFSTIEISNVYGSAPRIWNYLSMATERHPTLFLGYSYNDSSVFQALHSPNHIKQDAVKEKWILLKDPTQMEINYFHAMKFNVIDGTIEEFLKELPDYIDNREDDKYENNLELLRDFFKGNLIPNSKKGLPARSIIHFFQGMAPIWGDILSGNIARTTQYDAVINSLRHPTRNTIIIGAPLCGKSTVGMQAASALDGYSLKLFFDQMTMSRAEYLLKFIGTNKVFIMVENFAEDVEAFIRLAQGPNVKLLGLARSTDFGIISHMISSSDFDIINVTEITDGDFQTVFNSLPKSSRKERLITNSSNKKYRRDTIFEFVLQNIKGQSIEERYKEILENCYEEHAEFLTLCAYMHYCRVPLSIEVAASYFSDRYSILDMYDLKSELDDLLKELEDDNYTDQDYYYPRSAHLANVILSNTPRELLAKVLSRFVENVHQFKIPRYNVFKRHAFDHRLISKAFKSPKEGSKFYEAAFAYDYQNPYILQQMALYLAKYRQYRDAFDIIDKAKTMTNDAQFSIRNTHAIILFEANIENNDNDAVAQLDESMKILKKCYRDDKRKTYHAIVFAEQAIRYYKRLPSDITVGYLTLASTWLAEEQRNNPWDRECRVSANKLADMLAKIS